MRAVANKAAAAKAVVRAVAAKAVAKAVGAKVVVIVEAATAVVRVVDWVAARVEVATAEETVVEARAAAMVEGVRVAVNGSKDGP